MEKSVQKCIGFFIYLWACSTNARKESGISINPSKTVGIKDGEEYETDSKLYSLPKDRPKFIYHFGDKR